MANYRLIAIQVEVNGSVSQMDDHDIDGEKLCEALRLFLESMEGIDKVRTDLGWEEEYSE